ncbi:hypothetical protein ES332_D05G309800v1 [Gossypium tomentosum]|uniref:Uncharacterized protein n=1 Tax=Gossypium tomentosum TaxID=34277 RepID=A0A5D2L2D6_GOSTO|nr:hypothetical protein ES332_D05G309800v1 [Gossypium tomentosum]
MPFSDLFPSTSPIFCVLVSFDVIFTYESSCTSWIIPLLLPLCCITVHSWRSCPSFPQPKQNFGSFSYLKGIQYLFPLSLKTNIPLRRGFLYV